MTHPDWGDLLDAISDIDWRPSGLRRERPTLYHGVVIGIVVVLAVAVYLLVW